MKKIMYSVTLILLVIFLLPLSVLKKDNTLKAVGVNNYLKIPKAKNAVSDKFIICNPATNETFELDTKDYIIGVVSAEMPALYETEALKAQAVAAYTYACYRKAENKDKSYDITTDHTTDQSFISVDDSKKRWGEKADEYYNKIKSIVDEVAGYMITYDGKPAMTPYHAISSGRTESCVNVWGKDIPYLIPADSPGDKLSPDYISKLTVSSDEFKEKMSSETKLDGEPSTWVGKSIYTESEMVSEITIGNTKFKGSRIRSIFSLRSSNFKLSYSDGHFTFTVLGYGHGVGMSQYGANYLAKQGSNFKEILTCYYKGCKVEKI